MEQSHTDAWTTAKLRLADFLKEKRQETEASANSAPLVSEAVELSSANSQATPCSKKAAATIDFSVSESPIELAQDN